MMNGHNIPYLASVMPGVVINMRASMPSGSHDVPPEVQNALRAAISNAFDALPIEQRPENKKHCPDDFGQHKLNVDDSTHNFRTSHSYERLYITPTPSESLRGAREKHQTAKGLATCPLPLPPLPRFDDSFHCVPGT